MDKQLTKRKYLGEGYVHVFKNDKTGAFVNVPCTKEEYEALGLPGGNKNNPTKAGHTWQCSCGGTVKVDTPDSLLGFNEYCDYKDGYFVQAVDSDGKLKGFEVGKEDIVNGAIEQDKIDQSWQ